MKIFTFTSKADGLSSPMPTTFPLWFTTSFAFIPSSSSLSDSVAEGRLPLVKTCSLFVAGHEEGVFLRLKYCPEFSTELSLFELRSISTVEELQPVFLGNAFEPSFGVKQASDDVKVDA